MDRSADRFRVVASSWSAYCALIVGVFVVRAVLLLTVLPPFEGWDEYQHLAVMAYMAETGETPVLEKSFVPTSMYADLVSWPHSDESLRQLGRIGARSYADFFTTRLASEDADLKAPLGLYQAQHSPLYYRLATPLYRRLAAPGELPKVVLVFRCLNVLCGAATIAVVGWALSACSRSDLFRRIALLLLGMQPLFLLNIARVSNDALGILLGTASAAIVLVVLPKRPLSGACIAGLLLGGSVMAKTTNLGLAPFLVVSPFIFAWRGRMSGKNAVLASILMCLCLVSTTANYFFDNLAKYGVLTPMQEALINRRAGRGVSELLQTVSQIDWWYEYSRRYLRHSLWVGGWSFLRPATALVRAQQYLLLAAMLGGLIGWIRRGRRPAILEPGVGGAVAFLCIGVGVGLAVHMLHTKLAMGFVGTNVWYAAASFPWLLALATIGFLRWPGRWNGALLALALACVYAATEFDGLFRLMAPHYAGGASGEEMWRRLTLLHPVGPGPSWTISAAAAFVALVATAAASILGASRVAYRAEATAEVGVPAPEPIFSPSV